MSNHFDDRALLQQFVRERSEVAFGAIVRHYIPLVYHAALRQVRQEQLAEDVTQGVFVLLAQKAHTLADGAFLAGWLHKATRYACANALRTENRRRKLETKAARMKNTLVEDTATLSEGDWKQLSPALDDALGRLARKDRDLLLMRYFESLETADLAVRMGISEEAARKRLSRAIDRLREVLERRGVSASNLMLAGLMARHFAPQVPGHLIGTVASGSLGGASKAAAVLAATTASSMFVAKLTLMGSIVAAMVTVVGGAALVHSIVVNRAAARPIKVGWMVSEWTADEHLYDGPGTFDCVTAIRPRFLDPQIQLYAIVEPGTERVGTMPQTLRAYFEPGRVINGADADALSKMDVIVCSRDWNMRPNVMAAILKAVGNGTGLLRHIATGLYKNDDDDADVARINCTDEPVPVWNHDPMECRIVNNHPLLAGIEKNLPDGKLMIASLNGCQGVVHGMPLIVASDVVDGIADGSGVANGTGNPSAEQVATMTTNGPVFCPMFISQIGKGRVVACQWDSIPKPLYEATNGRFYIHCVQWLANRPIQ